MSRSNAGNLNRRFPASYTVEAACIMAIVLFSLASMIMAAYRLHDKTAGAMAVQEAVEKCRHEENRNEGTAVKVVYLRDKYEIEVRRNGKTAEGKAQGKGWELNIQGKQYDPEGFLRKLGVMEDGIFNKGE